VVSASRVCGLARGLRRADTASTARKFDYFKGCTVEPCPDFLFEEEAAALAGGAAVRDAVGPRELVDAAYR